MDRINLDEQIELLRGDEPEVADARRNVAQDERQSRRSKKIQAFDAAVGASMREVAAPQGLADRLLEHIGREKVAQRIRSRRNYLVSGAGVAVALTLLIGFSFWRRPDQSWTSTNVAAAAAKLYRDGVSWPPANGAAPAFPAVPLRSTLMNGFKPVALLNKPANGFRLQAPTGDHAVAIVVDAAWFPEDFDFSATYSVTGDTELEVRFLPVPGGDEVCIFVARDPKLFESKALIF